MSRARILLAAPWLALALAGLVGCTPPANTDGGPDGGDTFQCEAKPNGDPVDSCKRPIDCGGGFICEKEEGATADDFGCCKKVFCQVDADCEEEEKCDVRRGLCVPKDLCDPGAGCPNGDLCVYEDGAPQCVSEAPAPATCSIAPAMVFSTHGNAVEVHAAGFDANGKLSPHATFTYAVSGVTGSTSGNAVTGECTEGAPCAGTITATSNGGATCTADFVVYPAVADADVRVTLFDQTTGAPVSGARVVARIGDTVVEGEPTDTNGSYTFAGAAGSVQSISAFPEDHQWQTVIAPTGNDVALYTVAVPDDTRVAGVKGQFDFNSVSTTGDIKLGLTGMSISSAITDLDFASLLGEIADYNIVLEGVTDADGEVVPLPSGLVLELGPEPIKGDFVTFGREGRDTLWALGGKVRLADIGPIISSVTSSEDVNVGSILTAVLPFFARFDHAVVSGLELTETTRPAAPGDGTPVPYGDWDFTELTGANAVKLDTLLSQSANYTVPTLPCKPGMVAGSGCTDNAYASGAVLLSGVIVPGQGLVPLGLTAGLDDPDDQDEEDQADGQIDHKDSTLDKGQVIVDFAPPHDGLEGKLYVTIAIGLDIDGLTAGALSASTITHITDSYAEGNTFPTAFLQNQGGTFTKSAAGNSFSLTTAGNADFYRLNLDAGGSEEWNIWFPAGTTTINLADHRPAAGVGSSGRDGTVDVQAFKLGTGYSGAKPDNFGDLMAFNGTNLDNLLYYMGGWSSLTCMAPDEENPSPFCVEQTQQ